jgi:hypothetical protein
MGKWRVASCVCLRDGNSLQTIRQLAFGGGNQRLQTNDFASTNYIVDTRASQSDFEGGNSRLERALRLDDQEDSATKGGPVCTYPFVFMFMLIFSCSFCLSSNFFALVSVLPNFLMCAARIFVGRGRCYVTCPFS